ncbi:heterocyst-inhibiting protein PatX [Anabaenopsis elenkinii]|uniref:Uncharacterized protein n=1 Tax=Anabaenopsis elenkinii CCIBt3563 TaxID=2779889 RepID=A0A7U3RZL4_9CYAN|nr:hypothetical protein IM676_14145 [Anabaenopsis elenkinii CCIBt3563]
MGATISLLVSSLVFSVLAVNCQVKANLSSEMLIFSSSSQKFYSDSSAYQAQVNDPEKPIQHRGSGRINSIERTIIDG